MYKQVLPVLVCLAQTGMGSVLFEERFDGLLDGPLHGQDGWSTAPSDAATVQSAVIQGGSGKACELSNPAGTNGFSVVQHVLSGGESNMVVWSDLYARPMPVSEPLAGGPVGAAVVFYFNTDGDVVAQDGSANVILTGAPGLDTNTWTRMTVRADYSNQLWSLWLDGTLVARDLAFASASALAPRTIGCREGASDSDVSYIDTIRVATTPPSGFSYEEESDPVDTIPFGETFENTFPGDVNGQRGWQATFRWRSTASTNIAVQREEVRGGANACRIAGHPSGGTVPRLIHGFSGVDSNLVVQTHFWAKPVFVQSNMVAPDDVGAAFCVQAGTGYIVVFDGGVPRVLSSKPALEPGEWAEFLISCNYRSKTWSLEANGVYMASNLAFQDTSIESLTAFGIDEGSTISASYVDDIRICYQYPTVLIVR